LIPLSDALSPLPAERAEPRPLAAPASAHRQRWAVRAACASLMLVIFLVDTLTTLEGAVAVLYVVAVMLAARTARRADIVVASAAGIALTLVAYLDSYGLRHVGSQTVRALVSLSAIAISALLALQNQRAVHALSAQATLLDLSHDMIFVRDHAGVITFWNRTAEETYGWTAQEATGRVADALLHARYPQRREAIEAQLLREGRWEGQLEQTGRDGRTRVLDSRWVLQRDARGRPRGVLETHTDVTDRQAAYAALVRSEQRYRRMFDASRIGVVQQDWSAVRAALSADGLQQVDVLQAYLAGHPEYSRQMRRLATVHEANPAFRAMIGAVDGMPAAASLDALLDPDDAGFAESLLAFARGDAFFEGETEMLRGDGSRVPILFTITFADPQAHGLADDAGVLVFVVDITERRQAQDAALAAQAELAHATRVATLGELTASIAHEINQPLMAVVTNGQAGLRWLHRQPPELHEVDAAISRIVSEGRRASEIVSRVRDFLAKAPVRRQALQPATLVEEAASLVRHELARAGVWLRLSVAPGLPAVLGDRVQLEQVLVNLMLNASQAMATQAQPRMLTVEARLDAGDGIAITVSDSGPGIAPAHLERLFEPFFTTRPQGMGMGLAICRSTVQAHGGQLCVQQTSDQGSCFLMRLPAHHGTTP